MAETQFGEKFESVPSVDDVFPYLLFSLWNLGGSAHGSRVVVPTVAGDMLLSDEILEEDKPHKSGIPRRVFADISVPFAMSHLRIAGYIEPTKKSDWGYWDLSKKGKKWVLDCLSGLDDVSETKKKIESLKSGVKESVAEHNKKRNLRNKKSVSRGSDTSEHLEFEDFEEEKKKESVRKKIEKICPADPYKFEIFCISILNKAGMNMEHTKGSGDGGIDAVGSSEVGLMSFTVVMQAKRYRESNIVNEKEMRDFLGAMAKNRAEKGVFITTSRFAEKAKLLANEHAITLIDGERLVEIMHEKKIGYS